MIDGWNGERWLRHERKRENGYDMRFYCWIFGLNKMKAFAWNASIKLSLFELIFGIVWRCGWWCLFVLPAALMFNSQNAHIQRTSMFSDQKFLDFLNYFDENVCWLPHDSPYLAVSVIPIDHNSTTSNRASKGKWDWTQVPKYQYSYLR